MFRSPSVTRSDAVRSLSREFAAAGVPDPQADARLLLCAASGIDRAALVRDPDLVLAPEAARRLAAMLARRRAREPVSRILGRREFWGLTLAVTRDVLDPRPDTETVIEAVLEAIGRRRGAPLRIVDLGTGSGAILCALLSEFPSALGWAVDRSEAACAVARQNLRACGLADRSLVVCGDWATMLRDGAFDVVASNPPYVESAALAGLAPEVRSYDPHAALDGGEDGLAAYRILAPVAARLLAPAGLVAFEVGRGQDGAVAALLAGAELGSLRRRPDLAGITRVVSGSR